MSPVKRVAVSFALGLLGYVIGLFGGLGLVLLLSSNEHDRSMEAAMTGAFVVGPLFAVVGFFRGKS